ncbi:hypothetical protein [Nocardiopsis sp. FR26]|uniref:hypothetical protein n=1 Tax=Nocardiopsis sp. FR26 TaxID=2605987 RepID=UPI00135CDEB0|nr:hypothetical protein [Nocardiopsis sp. FR26]
MATTGADWPERTQAWQQDALLGGLAVELLPEQSTDGRPLVEWEGAVYVLQASADADGLQTVRAHCWDENDPPQTTATYQRDQGWTPRDEAGQRALSQATAAARGHGIVEE